MTTLMASKGVRTIPQMTRRCIRYSSSKAPHPLQDKLRNLMVHCAQPVAIVTTRLLQHHPSGEMNEQSRLKDQIDNVHEFHGATISSFSSIAMHPYPLVAFSLQLPSRLANALHAHTRSDIDTDAKSTSVLSKNLPAHFVINVLSTTQKEIAHQFSRPDLYPRPLAGVGEDRMKLTKEDQPMLVESVGCISCAIVYSFRSDDLTLLGEEESLNHGKQEDLKEHRDHTGRDRGKRGGGKLGGIWGELPKAPKTSELFIARVIRLETLPTLKSDIGQSRMPLVYFRKGYTTPASPGTSGAVGTS